MKKGALLLLLVSLVSKIFGFCRDIVLSNYFGATAISDAYLISLTIPMVIFAFVGAGIHTGFIPMYSRIEQEKGTASADSFTNNLSNFMLLLCSIIILICIIFTVPCVKIFASGFEGKTLSLAVHFTRISVLGIYFWALIYILGAYLQLKDKLVAATFMGIPFNLIMILSIIASSSLSIDLLPAGSVLAVLFQLLFLLPLVFKQGLRYSPHFNIQDEYLRKLLYLSIPVIIGVSVNQINILVDKTIASQMTAGGISILNYASKLNDFIYGVFIMSIVNLMYAHISKKAAQNDMDGLKKSVSYAVNEINLLVIPAAVGVMLLSKPLVSVLFGRGAFDLHAVTGTSNALFFYTIGIAGMGQREVLAKVFYSMQDTKTPMRNAVIALAMNLILSIVLSRFMGVCGIAFATSIAAIFCMILLYVSLRKKIGCFITRSTILSFVKILCSSLLMGMLARLAFYTLCNSLSATFSLIISIFIAAFAYLVLVLLLRVDETAWLIEYLKNRTVTHHNCL